MTSKFQASRLRKTILDMAYSGSTVHIACAFSLVEIMAVLYREFLGDLESEDRNYLVLSKGHGVMAQYACLHEAGLLEKSKIQSYFKDGTDLKGLADAHVRGIEVTSGSLGHGLSVGVGLALAAKLKKTPQKIYAIVGDGEANEGSIWEALLFAAHWKLDNLIVIFDMNQYQAMGRTEDVMNVEPMDHRLKAFNFETLRLDGHDEVALSSAIRKLNASSLTMPKAIIADTIKGKGISFMDGDNRWHYSRLTAETYGQALAELAGVKNA